MPKPRNVNHLARKEPFRIMNPFPKDALNLFSIKRLEEELEYYSKYTIYEEHVVWLTGLIAERKALKLLTGNAHATQRWT